MLNGDQVSVDSANSFQFTLSFLNLQISYVSFLQKKKWKPGSQDLTPEDEIPVGKNVLELTNIMHSNNFTCIAASTLGQIEATAVVKVQCEYYE